MLGSSQTCIVVTLVRSGQVSATYLGPRGQLGKRSFWEKSFGEISLFWGNIVLGKRCFGETLFQGNVVLGKHCFVETLF